MWQKKDSLEDSETAVIRTESESSDHVHIHGWHKKILWRGKKQQPIGNTGSAASVSGTAALIETAWLIPAAGVLEVWQENVYVIQYAGSIICSLLFFLDAPSFCIPYVSFVRQLKVG